MGSVGKWFAQTPAANVRIIGVYSPPYPVVGNPTADCSLGSDGYDAEFVWGDNGQNFGRKAITINCHGQTYGMGPVFGINQKIQSSRYFGWQVACSRASGGIFNTCNSSHSQDLLNVSGMDLEVQATSGPILNAVGNNLWYQTGWVRGAWSTDLAATDPTGVCGLQEAVNGVAINTYIDFYPDTSNWSQCPGSQINSSVDTSRYSDGAGKLSLWLWASNAAGATSALAHNFNVDNQTPSVTLSGPTNAPSTSGTQYVTATATAGPSGVAGISCTVDGGPMGWYAGASAQIPVGGLGGHSVSCYAQNNAVNASGVPGTSGVRSWQLKIGQPTIAAISFSKLINALRCHHSTERVKVLGRPHTIVRHGRKLKVTRRARYKTVKVIACHPRTVRKRVLVTVTVRRHGKLVQVRRRQLKLVPLLPRRVNRTTRRVAFGHGSTVSGWLGLSDGTALSNQTVRVMSAPDDGRQNFTQTAVAKTASDGTWTAKLPAGASRLIEAAYDGTATTESTTSSLVRLTVPAKLRIAISPRAVRWGDTIHISGRVLGGHIPNSSKLLRLDIGIKALHAIQGIPEISPDGRFNTTYTFNHSTGIVRFYFTVSTLAEADYPFAPGRSRRVGVTVGARSQRR